MSGVIGALIGSFVKPPFVATGGNETLTQNGWRYHIFRSSGTFTITSGESILQVLRINGGFGGGQGFTSGSQIYGGEGGSAAGLTFGPTTSAVNSSFSVTVAGAGGFSSVTPSFNATSVFGGVGGSGGQVNANYYPSVVNNASGGASVSLINTRGTPWSLLSLSQATNAGGGGGGAFSEDWGCGTGLAAAQPGGGGAGGYSSIVTSGGAGGAASAGAGANAPANSGAGGGGGGYRRDTYCGSLQSPAVGSAGNGGSGIVIVAYPVA